VYVCQNSGHKIANLDLLTERRWPSIFPRLMHVTHLNYISFLMKESMKLQQRQDNAAFQVR